jgi:hypothetical protein
MAGFIIGFDSDTEDIFDRQIEFITQARIPMAMVGPLNAMPNTELWTRLQREGRLRADFEGDNLGLCNFETKLPALSIASGYKHVLATLYAPGAYFGRLKELIASMKGSRNETTTRLSAQMLRKYAVKLTGALGFLLLRSEYRREYASFLYWVLRNHPDKFLFAVARAIVGYHFIKYTADVMVPRLALKEKELAAAEQPELVRLAS